MTHGDWFDTFRYKPEDLIPDMALNAIKYQIAQDKKVLNSVDDRGNSALILACHHDTAETRYVDILLKNGADVNIQNKRGYSALHYSLYNDLRRLNYEFFDMLLKVPNINIECRDEYGRTPLMYAVFFVKNPVMTSKLIRKGADVNSKTNLGESSILINACGALTNAPVERDWQFGSVKILLAQPNLDINYQEKDHGKTALIVASESMKLKLVRILAEAGAKLYLKDDEGMDFYDYGNLLIQNWVKMKYPNFVAQKRFDL